MKKFTLSILAVVMAAFILTSCIDNAVSSEVKALRAAQVAKVNAQTALLTADAQFRAAETALKNADAAYRNAETDGKDIANQSALLTYELAVAAAEATYETAALNLLKAQNATAEYVATYQLTLAATYLASYETASLAARTYAEAVAAQVELIAGLELYYKAGAGNNAYYATIEGWYERDLAEAELNLANKEAALEVMLAIEADPAAAVLQQSDLKAQIQDLDNKILAQAVVIAPLQVTYDDANLADNTATAALAAEDAAVAAIATIEGFNTKNDVKIADATTAAATALTDANAKYARQISQLAPFVSALETTYAAQGAFGDSIINIVQATRVAINALRVSASQEETSTGSAATAFGKAKTSVNNVITRIRTISGRSNVQMPWDATDEKKYPNFAALTVGDYSIAVTALTAAIAANDTYTVGGVTYKLKSAAVIGDTFIAVTGNGVPTLAGGTLTKATSATGQATITFSAAAYGTVGGIYTNGTTGTAGALIVYAANDEDGILKSGEIDDMIGQLIGTTLNTGTSPGTAAALTAGADLNPANATTSTTLSSNYKSAVALYAAVSAFFSGGQAATLVTDIGKYKLADVINDFQSTTNGNGVFANIKLVAFTPGQNTAWTDVLTANAAVTTAKAYFTAGIKIGAAAADGVAGDGTAGTDGDNLLLAYKTLKDYSATDTYTQGGSVDAAAMKVAVTAAQVAAAATLAPLKATTTAAKTALDAAKKVSDAVTGYAKTKADVNATLTAVNALLNGVTGINVQVALAKDAVETAESGVDTSEKALANLAASLEHEDAKIAYEEARLEDLEAKYDAKVEEAAGYLELLIDALGN